MPTIEVVDRIELAIARGFSGIANVTHVLTELSDRSLAVWIAVDDPNTKVRERIYQEELDLSTAFSDLDFEFHLVPSMGRRPAEIASQASVTYTRPS